MSPKRAIRCWVQPSWIGSRTAARGAEGAFSLLGANRAVIDPRKLTESALNPAHPVGGNKARVFESALGFTKGNADDLMVQLRQGVMNNPAMAGKVDQFGARFTVDIPVTGPAGSGAVRSGWIYKAGSCSGANDDLRQVRLAMKPRINDKVQLTAPLPDEPLDAGAVGVVVAEFSEPEEAYGDSAKLHRLILPERAACGSMRSHEAARIWIQSLH